GLTGFGLATSSAVVRILTLSTFIISGISSWKVETTSFTIIEATGCFGSETVTVTTGDFSALETVIFSAKVDAPLFKFSASMTSSSIAGVVIITLYVVITSTFVRIVLESNSSCSLPFGSFTINCDVASYIGVIKNKLMIATINVIMTVEARMILNLFLITSNISLNDIVSSMCTFLRIF